MGCLVRSDSQVAQSVRIRSAVDPCIEAHRIRFAALVGDADDLLSDTYTWLGANQLRKGVAYLVAPGSSLAFGARSVFCLGSYASLSAEILADNARLARSAACYGLQCLKPTIYLCA